MKEHFKKGQMVPKRLKMAITHRKAQHQLTFGCDVIVEGRTITAANGGSPIIYAPHYVGSRKMNNGTKQKQVVEFHDIKFESCQTAVLIG